MELAIAPYIMAVAYALVSAIFVAGTAVLVKVAIAVLRCKTRRNLPTGCRHTHWAIYNSFGYRQCVDCPVRELLASVSPVHQR